MKVYQLFWLICAAMLALPLHASAEIYKWKDKDGTVRYSDTPPPSNIKQESIGKKKAVKPVENTPPSPVTDGKAAPVTTVKPVTNESGVAAEDAAAQQRQRNAEMEKKNKEEKEAQAKLKDDNCKAAKANHETYVQGGRVSKMNEQGKREYLGDKELKEGAAKTQSEIDEYCN